MGAKNCPETPRQKMIGMMYLFLTAMLALNVSSEVLNGFGKVDESLRSSVESFDKRNTSVYDNLKTRYGFNKNKVEYWLNSSQQVKLKTDSLFEVIRNYKWDIVIDADGLPDTTSRIGEVVHIGAKDNIDAPTRIMIPAAVRQEKQKGYILRQKLLAHRDFMLSLLEDATVNHKAKVDSSLINSVNTYLTPKKEKGHDDGEEKEWEETYFSHMPVSASVVLLSKLQNDIKDVESLMINYFTNQVDANDFNVNKLQALIIPESNYIIRGGSFKAKILLAGEDTTKATKIVVDGIPLPSSKMGIYERVCNEVGTFPISGRLIYTNKDNEDIPLSFSTEFKVEEPSATVSATKMNVLYVGVENPVSISVPGVASQDIFPTISNGTLKKVSGGNYIAIPAKQSTAPAIITVNATINDQKVKIADHPFRVKLLPDPLPFFFLEEISADASGNIVTVPKVTNESSLPITSVGSMRGLKAELKDSEFEVKYEIKGYSIILINKNGNSYPETVSGNEFTPAIKNFLNNNFRGDIVIKNIKAKGPDGLDRDLPALFTTIN